MYNKDREGITMDTRKYEYEYDWDYVESEGSDCTRYDWANGSRSMWVYSNGSIDGNIPKGLQI